MARPFDVVRMPLAAMTLASACLLWAPAGMAGAAPLDAVGRITYGAALQPGHAICSGTLVSADLVLTAGHCLRSFLAKPGSVHFSAAWKSGRPTLERVGAAVILAAPDKPQRQLAGDAALLRLDRPVTPDEAQPLPLADPRARHFAMMGFDRSAPGVRRFDPACALTAADYGVIGLSCPVVSGNSGAPVLQWDRNAWSVAAVMVAATPRGPVRAWAALVPEPLKEKIAAKP